MPAAQLTSATGSDPAQALSQLAAVSSRVTRTGTAVIGGVPTTAYRAEENLDKVAARLQARVGAKAAQAFRQEAKVLRTSTLPVRIWVDAHHLVRQIRYQVPIPDSSGSAPAGTTTATITFSRYGVPVALTPPPASETADVTSRVLQQARNSSG